jgi:hypothetical protein
VWDRGRDCPGVAHADVTNLCARVKYSSVICSSVRVRVGLIGRFGLHAAWQPTRGSERLARSHGTAAGTSSELCAFQNLNQFLCVVMFYSPSQNKCNSKIRNLSYKDCNFD